MLATARFSSTTVVFMTNRKCLLQASLKIYWTLLLRFLFSGRIEDRTRQTAEIEPSHFPLPEQLEQASNSQEKLETISSYTQSFGGSVLTCNHALRRRLTRCIMGDVKNDESVLSFYLQNM